jgi:hypothetical protein
MIGVSARSYVAAGLATAITGAMVATPVSAHTQVALPSLPSANVELSAFVSFAERTAAHAIGEAAVGASAVKNAVNRIEPASPGTTTPPAGLTSDASVVANSVNSPAAASTNRVSTAVAVQGSNSVNSLAAITESPSLLQRILAVPVLLAAIPVVLTAQALVTTGEDAGFGTVDVLAGLATGSTAELQTGIQLIGNTLGDFLTASTNDINALQKQVDAFGAGTDSATGNVMANALKAIGVRTPVAAAVTKTPVKTSAPKSSSPTAALHQSAPSSVNAAASVNAATKNSGATKTAQSGTPSDAVQSSASNAGSSGPKHASPGESGPKHAAAHAKGGK